jgi:CheY-like chemotaxis protein
MDAGTLAQACEPFFTTKGLDGTGLGLSMVQGFAEQSGGEVHIESVPGHGTTVQLWLPAVASASSAPKQQDTSAKLRGSGRVLLVDDVSDVLVTARAFLARAGFQVVQAGNGDQALAVLAAGERFDVVVSDYAMPGLNGVELIEQARALQPGLAALLITGFAEVGGADTLPRAVAILRKPFQRRELVEAVLHAIGRDATGQAGDGSGGRHGHG